MTEILRPADFPVKNPGLYEVRADDYHADKLCPAPSLSSSVGNTLLDQSPRHAAAAHPKLLGTYEHAPSRQMEIGTAAHRLLLGRGAEIVVIEADSYRSKDAKAQQMEAYEANKAPILEADHETVLAMVGAARPQLLAFPELVPLVNGEGHSEIAAVWQEGTIWCRALLDWLSPDFKICADLKTTSTSAHPAAVASRLFNCGAELQQALYLRGLHELGVPVERFLFVMLETEAPYCLSVVDLDAVAEEVGDEKARVAIKMWATCLAHDDWPAYEPIIATAEYPSFAMRNWTARVMAHEAITQIESRPDMRLMEAG